MKIVTWNVNGIRSLKRHISSVLTDLNCHIACFQETKVSRSQLSESIALVDGYSSYFSYPRKLSGYSGVATYCSEDFVPEDAEEGLSGVLGRKPDNMLTNVSSNIDLSACDLMELDSEGRVIVTYHIIKYEGGIKRLAVINVYCPRVDPDKLERHLYKMQFCHLLEAKTKELHGKGCCVIIVGDMNIACALIDHCDPGDEEEFNTSEARQWLKAFLSDKHEDDIGIMDAFRYFYPNKKEAYTCWNVKTSARATNFGTRIDYILVSDNLLPLLHSCEILSDYQGSDHCPVIAELKCESISEKNARLPSICTRLWPEFSGRQQTLQTFLQKTQALADSVTKSSDTKIQPKTIKNNYVKRKDKQKSIASFFKNKNSVQNQSISRAESEIQKPPEIKNYDSILKSNLNSNNNLEEARASSSQESRILSEDTSISSSPRNSQATEWKTLLKGPPKPPLCSGHRKECVLRTVKKTGPNYGRQFFMCAQPVGPSSNPNANCNFFKWITAPKINKLK